MHFLNLFLVERINFLKGIFHENIGGYRVSFRMLVKTAQLGIHAYDVTDHESLYISIEERERGYLCEVDLAG